MKNVLLTALLMAMSTSAFAENRAELAYNIGNGQVSDSVALSGEWNFFTLQPTGGIAPAFFVGAGILDSINSGYGFTVYNASVGAELPLTADGKWLAQVKYTYNWSENSDNASTGTGSLIYVGDAWRFEASAAKPDGYDWVYGATAERSVSKNFSVGVGGNYANSDYVSTSVFAAYKF